MCKDARRSLARQWDGTRTTGQPERCFAAPGMNGLLSSRLCEPLCMQVLLAQPQPHAEGGEAPRSPKHTVLLILE